MLSGNKIAPNPGGKASHALTWQTYQNRSSYIIETKDPEEIRTLARDEKLLAKKCSTLDAIIIKDANRAFDNSKDAQRFLENMLGKQVTRIGGENPGEGIKINNGNGLTLEGLDSEALMAIADILREAQERQRMTIEGQIKNPPAITASGLSEDEKDSGG